MSNIDVAILAADEVSVARIRRLLRPSWASCTVPRWGVVDQRVASADVAVMVEQDLSDVGFLSTFELLRMWQPDLPVVLCTLPGPENFRHVLKLDVQDLFLLSSESRDLAEIVWAASGESRFRRLSTALGRMPDLVPLCRRALQTACVQQPPALVDAIERAATGHVVYIRTVEQLATQLGCSRGYLSRSAARVGLRMGDLLRWITFLCGLALHAPGQNWSDVAARLGFGSHAAWTSFVHRLVGVTPSEAVTRPASYWWRVFAVQQPALGLEHKT